jgi:hypothetical protein
LVALLSCGTHAPSSRNHVSVQFRDSIISDYYLLSVRDSSIIAVNYTGQRITSEGLIASAIIIPVGKIERIVRKSEPSAIAPLAGGCLGGCIGFCSTGWKFDPVGDDDGTTPQSRKQMPYLTAGGFIAGFLLGYLLDHMESEYYPNRKDDLEHLRTFNSFYQTEPPELQKIK